MSQCIVHGLVGVYVSEGLQPRCHTHLEEAALRGECVHTSVILASCEKHGDCEWPREMRNDVAVSEFVVRGRFHH